MITFTNLRVLFYKIGTSSKNCLHLYSVTVSTFIVCSGLENREYGPEDQLLSPRDTLYPQKLALASPTRGGRSVGIVCLRTTATKLLVQQLGRL
jgi:hypothetical protein